VAPHRGGVHAVDRASGRVVWWHRSPPPQGKGQVGFPGSPALGDGLVFAGGLDGQVAAFRR
jgi:outer membrane protein assembly factor BamB